MSSKSLIAIGPLCAARPVLAQRPSSGPTAVTGNLGGNTIYGFPPGTVLLWPTLRNGDIVGPIHEAATAYENLRNRTCDQTLQGDGLAPRVYCSASPGSPPK